jgi:hypothetical protein
VILKAFIVVAIVWIALMPPLFTAGACTAEFDRESARVATDQKSLRSPAVAREYWRTRAVPSAVLAPDQCRKAKPRYLTRCGEGALVIAKVPVKDTICRVYRDDEIRVLLQYDDRDRLSRVQVDMNPFKSLPIPFTDAMLHWAR